LDGHIVTIIKLKIIYKTYRKFINPITRDKRSLFIQKPQFFIAKTYPFNEAIDRRSVFVLLLINCKSIATYSFAVCCGTFSKYYGHINNMNKSIQTPVGENSRHNMFI
jgi:hypothetical protein